MSCNCGCTNPTAVVPPINKLIYVTPDPGNGCALKQPYETLAALSFVPQAVAATQNLKVCAASNYVIGSCVLLIDAARHTQVQRVTGHSGTDTLILTAYANDYSDTTTTLAAPIYAQPLGICPPDTTSVEECFRLNARTDAAFVMPASVDDEGSAVAVTFTESVSLPLGAEVFIEGAGWMEVAEPPVGDFEECTDTHYFLNLGTVGNETPGQTVAGDAYAIIGRAPVDETFEPTSGDIIDSFTAGEIGTPNLTYPGSLSFNLAWTANLHIRWRVGHPTDDALVDAGGTHAHWRIKLANTQVNDYTSTTNAKSDASNDADMSGWMASSNWGDVVVEDVAAGAWVAWIEKYQQSGSDTFVLDTWRINITAHRKQASVS